MRYLNWVRIHTGRFLSILFAVAVFFFLSYAGGLRFFPGSSASATKLASFWLSFGFSSLIALIFLAVGSLIWLFARDRRVAFLLLCFSFTSMTTFVVETGSVVYKKASLPGVITGMSSPLALGFFAIFLLLFPRNYLAFLSSKEYRQSHPVSYYLLKGYLLVMSLLCVVAVFDVIPYYLRLPFFYDLYYISLNFYVFFVLLGIIITIIVNLRSG